MLLHRLIAHLRSARVGWPGHGSRLFPGEHYRLRLISRPFAEPCQHVLFSVGLMTFCDFLRLFVVQHFITYAQVVPGCVNFLTFLAVLLEEVKKSESFRTIS